MRDFYKSGRYLFAISIIAFGVIQIATDSFMSAFLPINQSMAMGQLLLYVYSILFLVSGVAMMIDKTARFGSLIAFFLFLISIIYPHFTYLINDLHNGGKWAVMGETIAFCAGSLIAIGIFSGNSVKRDGFMPYPPNKITTGRILFAVSILIFGIQHFMYGEYIATLIPAWIPFPVVWAYLIGIFFTAGFISLLFNIKTRLASTLLGFMFLLWVVCLHTPRVIGDRNKETEWTSLFIALGFCGIFFMLADSSSRKKSF